MENANGATDVNASSARRGLGSSAAVGLSLLLIGLWGCLSIYNAKAFGELPLHFAVRQMGWLALGICCFLLASRIPFFVYRMLAPYLAGLSLASLAFVLGFGVQVNGMRGWLPLPGSSTMLQPSEFAKMPFLLCLCLIAGDAKQSWPRRFIKMGLLALAFIALIGVEPDFGMAFVFFLGFALVCWLAGANLLLTLLAFSLFAALGAIFLQHNDYAVARIVGYLNPDADPSGFGWHIKQFQFTLAHGGLFGSSWGNALWSNAFLPLSHSDSVFASIVESAGFAGGLLVMLGFIGLAFAAFIMARKAKADDAKLLIFSTGALLAAQAMLHISVNTTLLPPTGITLPILSYGGSSMLSTMLALGVAYSAFREKEPLSPDATPVPLDDAKGS